MCDTGSSNYAARWGKLCHKDKTYNFFPSAWLNTKQSKIIRLKDRPKPLVGGLFWLGLLINYRATTEYFFSRNLLFSETHSCKMAGVRDACLIRSYFD